MLFKLTERPEPQKPFFLGREGSGSSSGLLPPGSPWLPLLAATRVQGWEGHCCVSAQESLEVSLENVVFLFSILTVIFFSFSSG